MRTATAILFSALAFSVVFAQQDKKMATPPPVPAKTATPAAVARTTPGSQEIETKANSLGLTVAQALIAKGIDEDNRPIEPGTEFASDVKKVYCITQIRGAKDPVNIEHRWYKDEALIHTIELPIKSLNWRTQSYKTISPTMTGKWKVVIVLMPGEEILTTLNFTVQ